MHNVVVTGSSNLNGTKIITVSVAEKFVSYLNKSLVDVFLFSLM
jgi:hypothetical protein